LSQTLQEERNSAQRLSAIDGQAKRINMNDLPMPTPGANALHSREETETMIFDKNIDIPLRDGLGLLRGNLYRPIAPGRYPVLITCEFFWMRSQAATYIDFELPGCS
jgi:predicted acyl esterase